MPSRWQKECKARAIGCLKFTDFPYSEGKLEKCMEKYEEEFANNGTGAQVNNVTTVDLPGQTNHTNVTNIVIY